MATYLVTGGAGFIGSHLAAALIAAGHDVTILDDLSTGKPAYIPEEAKLLRADVADPATISEALAGSDGCFHMAAIASVRRSNEAWLYTHRSNQCGSIAVFEAARTNGRIPVVYASSAAVYGDISGCIAAQEDWQPKPISAYGADKYGSELHAGVGWRVHGLSSFGCRLFSVYGPRQDASSTYGSVISTFVRQVMVGEPLLIHGDGGQVRDFILVFDAVTQLISAMNVLNRTRGAYIANVCTGRGTTVLELAHLVMKLTGRTVPIRHGPAKPWDIQYSVGETKRAEQLLGTMTKTDLAAGLKVVIGGTNEF